MDSFNAARVPVRLGSKGLAVACIGVMLLASHAGWSDDNDDGGDDSSGNSTALATMRAFAGMMQALNDNQAQIDAIRSAGRAARLQEQQEQAQRIANYRQQIEAMAQTQTVAHSYNPSNDGGLNKVFYPGINQCISLEGDHTLLNRCNVRAYVNWTDNGVCQGYTCSDEVPAGGETTITAVRGRFEYGACPNSNLAISLTWNEEHTRFVCWTFGNN